MKKFSKVLILTGGGGPLRKAPSVAFTMAEILLSLTIIGVVAAITLPSLTGNINERTWNTQRKALYARFSQAISLMPALNGYGALSADEDENTANPVAERFVTEGLGKVLKINNVCNHTNLSDCGLPSQIIPLDGGASLGSKIELSNITTLGGFNSQFISYTYNQNTPYPTNHSQYNTNAAAFETANGESILTYYYPNCRPNTKIGTEQFGDFMCANFVYDLNGAKGPNTVGKDIGFITAFYPTDPIVAAPMPYPQEIAGTYVASQATVACRNLDAESRLPNIDELSAISCNRELIGLPKGNGWYYSSSRASSNSVWYILAEFPVRAIAPADYPFSVKCIRR